MTNPKHRYLSVILFAMAPIPIIFVSVYYVVTTSDAFDKRAVVSAIVGALSLVSVVEQIRFVMRNPL